MNAGTRSTREFLAWIDRGRPDPAPVTSVGGSGDFVPGRRVGMPTTLTPGRYVAMCEVPARADGQPHYRHGMHQEIVVR